MKAPRRRGPPSALRPPPSASTFALPLPPGRPTRGSWVGARLSPLAHGTSASCEAQRGQRTGRLASHQRERSAAKPGSVAEGQEAGTGDVGDGSGLASAGSGAAVAASPSGRPRARLRGVRRPRRGARAGDGAEDGASAGRAGAVGACTAGPRAVLRGSQSAAAAAVPEGEPETISPLALGGGCGRAGEAGGGRGGGGRGIARRAGRARPARGARLPPPPPPSPPSTRGSSLP